MSSDNLTNSTLGLEDEDTFDLTLAEYVEELPINILIHGGLMILAWVVIIPFASIIPLLKRNSDDGKKWIYPYVILMLLGLGAAGTAGYFAFLFHEEKDVPHFASPHSIVGLITIGMAFVISLIGCFPSPESWKPLCGATMLWVGRAVIILGFVSVIVGLRNAQEVFGENEQLQFVLYGLIGFFAIGAIWVGIIGFRKSHAAANNERTGGPIMENRKGSIQFRFDSGAAAPQRSNSRLFIAPSTQISAVNPLSNSPKVQEQRIDMPQQQRRPTHVKNAMEAVRKQSLAPPAPPRMPQSISLIKAAPPQPDTPDLMQTPQPDGVFTNRTNGMAKDGFGL